MASKKKWLLGLGIGIPTVATAIWGVYHFTKKDSSTQSSYEQLKNIVNRYEKGTLVKDIKKEDRDKIISLCMNIIDEEFKKIKEFFINEATKMKGYVDESVFEEAKSKMIDELNEKQQEAKKSLKNSINDRRYLDGIFDELEKGRQLFNEIKEDIEKAQDQMKKMLNNSAPSAAVILGPIPSTQPSTQP